MTDGALKESFAYDVVLLKLVGMNPVVVHGGRAADRKEMLRAPWARRASLSRGMRVITDRETMDVVEMGARAARVNKEGRRARQPGRLARRSGSPARTGRLHSAARKLLLPPSKDNSAVDLGQVGRGRLDRSERDRGAGERAASSRWWRRSATGRRRHHLQHQWPTFVAGKLAEILKGREAGGAHETRRGVARQGRQSCSPALTTEEDRRPGGEKA